ncbi:MAG: chitobiase/beta-hexosaminidase C-terminal domain-containing protein [Spirochaetaceae bacterium]
MRTRRHLVLILVLLMSTFAGTAQESAATDNHEGRDTDASGGSVSSSSPSSQDRPIRFSPSPGTYAETVMVSVGDDRGAEAPRLWYRFADDDDAAFLPIEGGIVLGEVPGVAYRYTIEIAETAASGRTAPDGAGSVEVLARASYVVDPRVPPPPEPDPVPGVYHDTVQLSLTGAEGTEVTYAFARDSGPMRTYTDPVTLAAREGERSEYNVMAYASSEAGHRSEVIRGRYVIDATGAARGSPSLRIESPISGTFGNRQLLVVESTGVSSVRYTTDGSDPLEGGTAYAGPVRLERTGPYTVRVAATGADGRVLSDAVEVTVEGRELLDLPQGVITEDRRISPPGGTAYFTTDDRAPTAGSNPFDSPIPVSPSAGVRRILPVRVHVPEGGDLPAGAYRYTYVLEGRTPARPEAITYHGPETDGTLHLSLLSSPGAQIRYSTDGSPPQQGRLYTEKAAVDLPSDRDQATMVMRAVAVYSGTVESTELSKEISFDTRSPAPPSVSLSGSMHTAVATIEVSRPAGTDVVYAVGPAEGATPEPTRWSPTVQGDTLRIPAPPGSDRAVTVAFASVDAYGNRSAEVETVDLRLDGKGPPPPRIAREGRRLVIEGENVRYYLRRDREDRDSAAAATFAAYDGPLFLEAPPGGRMVHTVRAFSQDQVGNRSALVSERVVSDARRAELPGSLGVEDGGLYRRAVTLRNTSEEEDFQVRYAVSFSDDADEEVTDPGTPPADTTLGDGALFDAPEGVERRYVVALQPVFTSTNRTGSVELLSFTVDRKPPRPPSVNGIEDGRSYGSAVSFTVQPSGEGDRVEYRLTRQGGDEGGGGSGTASDPGAAGSSSDSSSEASLGDEWLSLTGGDDLRRVDVAVGADRIFTLSARSVDAAGNVTEMEAPVKFRIDRAEPAPPQISVDGAEPTDHGRYLATGAVTVTIDAEGAETYYRVSRDGAASRERGALSPADQPYEGPFDVEAVADETVRVDIQAMTRDAVGNESAASPPVSITIDRRPPDPPEVVDVTTDDTGRAGRVIWRHGKDAVVRYRVTAGGAGDGEFRTTRRIGRWHLPDGESAGRLEYYAEDRAGNRSGVATVAVRGFSAAPRPELAGVDADAVYGSAVVVQNRTATGTVRYEVSTDGSDPPAVTRFSPELPARVPFDAAPGEAVGYRVAARTFAEDARPSPVVVVSFTVDREAPEAPRILGFRDGDFLTEDVEVAFEASGNPIRYSVIEGPEGRTVEGEFEPYEEPFTLEAKPGGVVHYRVSAYSVDRAGNRSEETRTWDLFLGKEIVYVAPEGSAGAAGTIDDPVNDLAAAAERAQRDGKRTIFVAGGDYTVAAPLTLQGSLNLQGGFDSATWRRTEESRSSLTVTGDAFTGAEGAVVVEEGRLTVGRFDIAVEAPASRTDGEARGNASEGRYALVAGDSALFVQNVALSVNGVGALRQSGGDVTFKGVRIVDERGGSGSLLSLEGGRTVLDGVEITGAPQGRERALLYGRNAQLFVQEGRIEPGGGDRSVGIRAESSRVVIGASEIHGGTGSRSARGVHVTGGTLRMTDSRVSTSERSRITTAVAADDARTTIEGSAFTLRGSAGVAGVAAQGGTLTLGRSSFDARNVPSGFIHLVVLRSTKSDLVANGFIAQDAGEAIVARVTASHVRFVNNTAITGEIRGAAYGINASGAASLLVQNSIFSHDGSGRGRAVSAADEGATFSIRTNSFHGWDTLYERSTGGFTQVRSSRSATVAALNDDGPAGVAAERNIPGSAPEDLDLSGRFPRLSAGAVEIDAGSEPPQDLPYRDVDLQGQQRPAPAAVPGAGEDREPAETAASAGPTVGAYDIGADEFYR